MVVKSRRLKCLAEGTGNFLVGSHTVRQRRQEDNIKNNIIKQV